MLEETIRLINEKVPGSQAILSPPPEAGDPYILVNPSHIKEVALCLRDSSYEVLQVISGIDYPETIEINYILSGFKKNNQLILKTKLPKHNENHLPSIESVSDIWPSANWQERECYDMVGIKFKNHPDLRRILTSEDWEGYPLRKSYEPAKHYNGMEINPSAKMNIADREFAAKQKAARKKQ